MSNAYVSFVIKAPGFLVWILRLSLLLFIIEIKFLKKFLENLPTHNNYDCKMTCQKRRELIMKTTNKEL